MNANERELRLENRKVMPDGVVMRRTRFGYGSLLEQSCFDWVEQDDVGKRFGEKNATNTEH